MNRSSSNPAPRRISPIAGWALPLLFLTLASTSAQDFDWSWENKGAAAGPTGTVAGADSKSGEKEPFKWTFDGEEELPAGATREKDSGTKDTAPAGIDPAAYNELLKENLKLRRKISDADRSRQTTREENERLQREIRDLDVHITESASLIADLKRKRASATGAESIAGQEAVLEQRLSAAEEEKLKMNGELNALRAKLARIEGDDARATVAAKDRVPPGSPLFRQLEQENAELRARLGDVRQNITAAERLRTEMARHEQERATRDAEAEEREKELAAKLAATETRENQKQRTVEELLEQIPALEQKIAKLESDAPRGAAPGSEDGRDVEALRARLREQEHRLMKAERMAAMLQTAQSEVREASDREKRDMHYNMAAVYGKEGRFRDAEREYLHALRVDPTDAFCHYNLGILYDDELNNPRRAAMHYRRYLKLRPHAPDVDMVKEWLMRLDMNR